ncbi:hypothetical protein [Snodgrassella sp. CFCC 13594]|uniref:hypothetical protein n=1 Tax=Snodgrassella sp. CFCC 13594 TaxID=1775559 RepID=UPI000834EFFE|nr:hypothetical protein [Snodgrassella sp. CFCC 13594]
MRYTKIALLVVTALILSGCVTPEQKAAQAARARAAQQQLALDLAAQCDPQAADLMRQQQTDAGFFTQPATAKAANAYRDKVSSPLFQSCYKLAWDNYLNQMRLQQIRNWELQRRMDADMDWMMRPRWCRGVRGGRPFVYQCW